MGFLRQTPGRIVSACRVSAQWIVRREPQFFDSRPATAEPFVTRHQLHAPRSMTLHAEVWRRVQLKSQSFRWAAFWGVLVEQVFQDGQNRSNRLQR